MRTTALYATLALLTACASSGDNGTDLDVAHPEADTTTLVFDFDGELLLAGDPWSPRAAVLEQLLFAAGELRGLGAKARLDDISLSELRITETPDGGRRVQYHALLPVEWQGGRDAPPRFVLTLPTSVDGDALEVFAARYGAGCGGGATGSLWQTFRPHDPGCLIDRADRLEITAHIAPAVDVPSGRYPEYHEVWADEALRIVAVFIGAPSDEPMRFIEAAQKAFAGAGVTASESASGVAELTYAVSSPRGLVQVTALRPTHVETPSAIFMARYVELAHDADILYLGDAGARAVAIAALSERQALAAGRHQIIVSATLDVRDLADPSLLVPRIAVNDGDPLGSRHLDHVFVLDSLRERSGRIALAGLASALAAAAPRTYRQALAAHETLILGDEDNRYFPGFDPASPEAGFVLAAKLDLDAEHLYEIEAAPGGTYLVRLSHDPRYPGGDVDLFVRAGDAPTALRFDCHPYLRGSAETCRITLPKSDSLHVLVRGYDNEPSNYVLELRPEITGGLPAWSGLSESGITVEPDEMVVFETPLLGQGTYHFAIDGDGDADLYVRTGAAPTADLFECRPFLDGSTEACAIVLEAPATIFIGVNGFGAAQVSLSAN
jgi:hypothetical protein